MVEYVKVPLNEPGLVQIRENPDGTINEDDLERLRVVYGFLGKSPAARRRLQQQQKKRCPRSLLQRLCGFFR
ncbi:hypothetical protein KKH05_01450 [Patescibacteria group bacterium]|nr:hypothetical protein [Patescibacteria group bacterium]